MNDTRQARLTYQINQLRKKMNRQRLVISQQLYSPITNSIANSLVSPMTNPETNPDPKEIVFPRSMTMRWLQSRPDLALRLLTKAGNALANGAVLKSLPLVLLFLVILRARNMKK